MSSDLVRCVLKEREAGYSISEIASFCRCSTYRVRKILKEHGDPLKRRLDLAWLICRSNNVMIEGILTIEFNDAKIAREVIKKMLKVIVENTDFDECELRKAER